MMLLALTMVILALTASDSDLDDKDGDDDVDGDDDNDGDDDDDWQLKSRLIIQTVQPASCQKTNIYNYNQPHITTKHTFELGQIFVNVILAQMKHSLWW